MKWIILVLLTLTACMPHMVRREPLKTTFDISKREALWQSAVVVLQEQNYPISLLDEKSGTIATGEVTGFRASCNDGNSECGSKESISLTISPTGLLIVNVNRQVFYEGFGTMIPPRWAGVEFKKDVLAVESRQQELVDLILTRVRTQTTEAPSSAPASAPSPVADVR